MTELRDRIEDMPIYSLASRFSPIPKHYIIHIRERFNDDGTVDLVHRKRVYDDYQVTEVDNYEKLGLK